MGSASQHVQNEVGMKLVIWRRFVAVLVAVVIGSLGLAATPAQAQAAKKMIRYGTRVDDAFTTLAALSDGSYVTGGYQDNNRNYWRTFIMRYSKAGKLLWKKQTSIESYFTFEVAKQIVVANDMAVAYSYSRSGKKLWRAKLATRSGCSRDGAVSIVGSKAGPGMFALSNCEAWGSVDASILVDGYNSRGQLQWERAIPAGLFDEARTLVATRDGGYMVGGHARNNNVPNCTSCSYTEPSNPVLAKFGPAGNLEWTYTDDRSAPAFAGTGFDYVSITELSAGGYVALQRAQKGNAETSILVGFSADGRKSWESSGTCSPDAVYHPTPQLLQVDGGLVTIGRQQAGLCKWSLAGATEWGVAYKGIKFQAIVGDGRGGLVAVGEAGKRAPSVPGKSHGGTDAVIGHFNGQGKLSAWR
jgi:hypothetical protein